MDLMTSGARSSSPSTALRPTDLVQRVRAVVFSTRLQGVDLDDFEDHSGEDITVRMARTEALRTTLVGPWLWTKQPSRNCFLK